MLQATSGFGENGGPQVNIELDSDGARAMVNATEGNIGRNLGVVLIEEITKTYFDEEGKVIQEKDTVEQVISNATIQDVLGARFRITGLVNSRSKRPSFTTKSWCISSTNDICSRTNNWTIFRTRQH